MGKMDRTYFQFVFDVCVKEKMKNYKVNKLRVEYKIHKIQNLQKKTKILEKREPQNASKRDISKND